MRWVALLVVLTAHMALPFVHASDDVGGRSEDLFDAVAPSSMVVHRNETVNTYITVQNRGSINQALTVEPLVIPSSLEVLGLPLTEVVVPNHLRQLTFAVHANATAAFQNVTASFKITSDADANLNRTVEIGRAHV